MKIGPYRFDNQVILAPMAGVTDLPFREICRQLGAGAVVGEMLSAKQELWHSPKSLLRQVQKNESGIRWIQILGNEPEEMAQAAFHCQEQGAHIIDINMGCPAKKVCKKAAGSALLQEPELVEKILSSVVEACDIPVTLKIRTGWAREHKNFLDIGHIAEQAGISALSIHGRTRGCKYTQEAEYDSARNLKQALSIPVIVNGDIVSAEKAQSVLDHTQADGIMVGRAALGNPWLFREIDQHINHNETIPKPDLESVFTLIYQHINSLHDFYGDYTGVRVSRKHLGWYQDNFPDWIHFRKTFNRLEDCQSQLDLISRELENLSGKVSLHSGSNTKDMGLSRPKNRGLIKKVLAA